MRLPKNELSERFKTAKILLVESDEFIRIMLSSVLSANGFYGHIHAKSGHQALEKINTENPDIVILGFMQGMDTFELCSKIRQHEKHDDLPILMQTALTNAEERLAAFEVGATDLINKPINPREFIARIKLHLENRFLIRGMEIQREKLDSELTQARQMQNLLLPKYENIEQAEDRYSLSISSYFETCDIMGGDFWGIEPLGQDLLAFYIADCTGHGVTAALNTFRLHAVIKDPDNSDARLSPAKFLSLINRKLVHLLSPGQFATMFYGVIDFSRDEIIYSSAASTPPVLIDNENNISVLPSEGFLLGIKKDAKFENKTARFHKGDRLMLYSDALIENINSRNEMFGEKNMLKLISSNAEEDSEKILRNLVSSFHGYNNENMMDDLTINIYTRF